MDELCRQPCFSSTPLAVQPPQPATIAPSEEATEPKPSALIPEAPPAIGRIPPASSADPTVASPETAALVARGDALVSAHDIASARLFYERAIEMGDGHAALRMGATFDPAFLEAAGIRGTKGDQREAVLWYRRARDLGAAEAERLLKKHEPH